MGYIFEIVAVIGGERSTVVHCEDENQFQATQKELFNEGWTYLSAYVFNERGFVRRTNYVRTKKKWQPINL